MQVRRTTVAHGSPSNRLGKKAESMTTGGQPIDCRDRRVARVLRYITQDLSRPITLPLAAEIAGLEAGYFSKRFHITIGIRFIEWNARVRTEEAKRLLEIDDLSITAVAACVGYGDVTTFARAFRRCEQLSPREYRRRACVTTSTAKKTKNAESETKNAETTREGVLKIAACNPKPLGRKSCGSRSRPLFY